MSSCLRTGHWVKNESGAAAAEFVLIFPVFFTMLLGVYELGNGILVNQKAISASQIIADLLTRSTVIDDAMLEEAILAGELAIQPYSTGPYGIDIVSIEFDDDGDPEIVWRETRNMDEHDDILDDVEAISDPGEGVVVVTVSYRYEPFFGSSVIEEIDMLEQAFARGRRAAVVTRDEGA